MMFGGRELGAKQFMTNSVSTKRPKKILLIDLHITKAIKYGYTVLCVVQSSMQPQQKDWNKYVHFQ